MLAALVTLTIILPPLAAYWLGRRLRKRFTFKNPAIGYLFIFFACTSFLTFGFAGTVSLFASISPEYHALVARP